MGNIKCNNICITVVLEEEREKGAEKIFKEVIAKNFLNMGKETVFQIQEAQRVPYRMKSKRNTPKHTVIKMIRKKKIKRGY